MERENDLATTGGIITDCSRMKFLGLLGNDLKVSHEEGAKGEEDAKEKTFLFFLLKSENIGFKEDK